MYLYETVWTMDTFFTGLCGTPSTFNTNEIGNDGPNIADCLYLNIDILKIAPLTGGWSPCEVSLGRIRVRCDAMAWQFNQNSHCHERYAYIRIRNIQQCNVCRCVVDNNIHKHNVCMVHTAQRIQHMHGMLIIYLAGVFDTEQKGS